jgi:hypothetical protein
MGLRASEIRYLKWSNFFEADDRLWCDVDGKGGKRARMYVHAQVRVNILPRLRASHTDPEWLFPSPRAQRAGLPVGAGWVDNRHWRIVEEAGIPHCTLHQLRHSFAAYLRRTGVDIAVVKEGLRHANLASTEIYTGVLPEELADAMDNLDFKKFRGASPGSEPMTVPWQSRSCAAPSFLSALDMLIPGILRASGPSRKKGPPSVASFRAGGEPWSINVCDCFSRSSVSGGTTTEDGDQRRARSTPRPSFA